MHGHSLFTVSKHSIMKRRAKISELPGRTSYLQIEGRNASIPFVVKECYEIIEGVSLVHCFFFLDVFAKIREQVLK